MGYNLKKNWIKGRKKPGDGYKDRSITHDRDKSWTGLASAERIENLYGRFESFLSGKSFSIWLNQEHLPSYPEKGWIKEASSKAVKKAMEDECIAFTRFFKERSILFYGNRKKISD